MTSLHIFLVLVPSAGTKPFKALKPPDGACYSAVQTEAVVRADKQPLSKTPMLFEGASGYL